MMEAKSTPAAAFGHMMRHRYFGFDKIYKPLNHGSFGAFPTIVQDRQQEFQRLIDARPDTFLRYEYPELLKESRAAVAPLLGIAVDEVVFVPNATTGVNTVLRNLTYSREDVILYFSSIYGACEKTIASLCETTAVESVEMVIEYPLEDEEIVQKFRDTVKAIQTGGKRVKIAIFDTVLTFPGVRFPWEALVKSSQELGVLSLIDGAHGIGHIDLTELGEVGPDFFVSNCYKWLFVPRGCAVLYVPFRNQHLIRTSIPTSWGYEPRFKDDTAIAKPVSGAKSAFVHLFEKVSTIDITPYICVPEALKFRMTICGGEESVRDYCQDLVRAGGTRLAEILGTEVLENTSHSLHNCCFTNVRLPLRIGPSATFDENGAKERAFVSVDEAPHVAQWIIDQTVKEFETYIPTKVYAGAFWTRISGQIYLEIEHFEWAGRILQTLCERVERGEGRATLLE